MTLGAAFIIVCGLVGLGYCLIIATSASHTGVDRLASKIEDAIIYLKRKP